MIPIDLIHATALELMSKAAIDIPDDYLRGLERIAEAEDGELSSFVLQAMLENYRAAKQDRRAMCGDTGCPRWYVKMGNEASIEGGPVALETALRRATAEATCFQGSSGRDMVHLLDMSGYASYSVTSCLFNPGDSSIAVFDDDPTGPGVQLACSEDAGGEGSYCSKVIDPNMGGAAPILTPVPATNEIFILIDEWISGIYWNGVTDRGWTVEML